LANALRTALTSTAVAAHRAACAQRHAAQHFTADRMVRKTLELYEQSLSVRGTCARTGIPARAANQSAKQSHAVRLGI